MERLNKKGVVDVLHLIIGVMLVCGGFLYMFNFGSLGLIVASIWLLMEAMKHLVAHVSRKVRLLIVGPDEYVRAFNDPDPEVAKFAQRIRQDIDTHDLRDIVQFEGRQDNVEEYYKAADIFVHPSRREGQPNAIIEAMVSGLPVVVNHIEGITTEMVDHFKTGFIVNCEDSQLLARTIQSLVDNADLRQQIGENASENTMAKHDIYTVGRRYLDLYNDIACPRFERSHHVSGFRKITLPLAT